MAELAHGDDNVAHLMGKDLVHPAWNVLSEGLMSTAPAGPARARPKAQPTPGDITNKGNKALRATHPIVKQGTI